MTDRFPVATTPDRPEFRITIDGADLDPDAAADVVEIDVHEEIGHHARLTLLLQNWDPDQRQVRHSDGDSLKPGAPIEVSLGYHSELTEVFSGRITAVTAHFTTGTAPTVAVEARSRSALLAHPLRSRVAEDSSVADVAAAIASDRGLTADVGESPGLESITLDRISEWAWLKAQADLLGFVLYVRGDKLVFRLASKPDPDFELVWGKNLTELHLSEDSWHRTHPITGSAWDTATLEAAESEQQADDVEFDHGDRDDVAEVVAAAHGGDLARIAASPGLDQLDHAAAVATGIAERQARMLVSGYGATIGVPALRIDQWLTITGTGSRFDGPHYVTATRHRLGTSGYTTEFQLGEPQPLRPPADPVCQQLLLGTVEDLDDPQGLGRVKVGFPWRIDAPESVWCRLGTAYAGPTSGAWFVPDVGQEVLVGYADGLADAPIVLASLWNGVQEPPVEMDAPDNNQRGVVTRSGHRVMFDDGDAASITIETASGRRCVLEDKDGSITLQDDASSNEVIISSDGISLTAAQGDIVLSAAAGKVKLDAMGIEGKATGPSKLESSATLDLKASATLGISAPLVNIN